MQKRDAVKLGVLLALWGGAFAPLYPELVQEWLENSDNSHAFLVPFIALFFIRQKKEILQTVPIASSAWGGILFAAGLLIYVVSWAGGLAFPARVAMVACLFGMLWFCLGSGYLRQLVFPLSFLFFMIPVPYSLISLVSVRLQLMATHISAALISRCSIPVYQEGNMLYFVQTQLEVAEACSGIRSIVSLTMIALVLCSFSRRGWLRKASLIAAAIPIAIVANIVRVTGTGILAHFFGDTVARGFLHQFSGMVVFGFGLALLCALFFMVNSERVRHGS
ncbi:exosortase/archaeosortase family protein [Geobacter sp. SVR]|uniref:exosortase/archaeosortase family protein n=1 Tax=Geobacter sp. SVR TaxID=2495594 RepID=UPI00143F01BB|nr:exosortase/archaeosortase family protein [Geobacter sp. SVR]BCS54964.1 exosortase [Geobacter sp. SVR]GCF86163.1 exosortase A [Geobacter sp. SVR]